MGAEVRAAMFFAGLILLIPHRIGMSRVNYIIKRYNLPISRAGLLLYKYHNNIELSLFIGNLVGFAFTLIIVATIGNDNKGTLKWSMIGVCFFMLISSIILFILYILGGDFGHLNAFYFSLIFTTFCDGATNPFAFACNGANASLYAAGIPISGFLVTLFHNVYKFIFDSFNLDDFDYYVLFLQLIYNIITIFTTIILWYHSPTGSSAGTQLIDSANKVDDWGALFNSVAANDHYKDWSPILMLAFSLGTVYIFYPSIAPYSIIDYQYASVIELWILCISSSPTLLFAILDLCTEYISSLPFAIGPSGKTGFAWEDTTTASGDFTINPCSGVTTDNGTDGTPSSVTPPTDKNQYLGMINNWSNHFWWHCVWFCAIPYILCIQIFMSLLHYPDCFLSSFFNNKPLRIGFISVLFNTLRECMQACGFAGAGKQVKDNPSQTYTAINTDTTTKCKASSHHANCQYKNDGSKIADKWDNSSSNAPDHNQIIGTIASTNKPITLFVMMFCVFTGDGYLQHYRRCCRDNWPTTGYNKYQSFFYWLHFGFKGGIKSITSSFTDLYYHNLRPQFISYA